MEIRNYEDRDLEACRDLYVHMTEWHRTIYDAPAIGGDNPGKHFDEQLAKVGPQRIWVAEQEGRVVGMIGLQPGYGEAELEIEPVVVLPEARGSGVGRAMVEHLIIEVEQLGHRDLNVHVVGRNAEAIQFYHEVGFDVIGHFELFYDTTARDKQIWRDGETIAGRRFRV